MAEIDFTDPWEKERQEKRRKVMRWVLGGRPRPGAVILFSIPGLFLLAGARIGISVAGTEPIWIEIPAVFPLGIVLVLAGIVEELRCWGHEALKWIRLGREASEVGK
ncbi:MAG: hypothetical protein GX600_01615 [Dehalococcoidia bacterium]|nr:hypothetical protein [Dehalococcoidia bacterium]